MIPIQIHLAETQAEIGLSQERHKMRPVAILDSLKFWAPVTIAAHGVWINADEIALLKQRNVGVSNNPESNMKLASGTAPVIGVSRGRRERRARHRRRRQQQRPRHVRGDAPGGASSRSW